MYFTESTITRKLKKVLMAPETPRNVSNANLALCLDVLHLRVLQCIHKVGGTDISSSEHRRCVGSHLIVGADEGNHERHLVPPVAHLDLRTGTPEAST